MTGLRFNVIGTPAPKGSLKNIARRGQKARLIESNPKTTPWREAVRDAAIEACAAARWETLVDHPVELIATIYLAKPPSVRHRVWPIKRSAGDSDKHARTLMDALQDARVYTDDAQVVSLFVTKVYATTPGKTGATIRVNAI